MTAIVYSSMVERRLGGCEVENEVSNLSHLGFDPVARQLKLDEKKRLKP